MRRVVVFAGKGAAPDTGTSTLSGKLGEIDDALLDPLHSEEKELRAATETLQVSVNGPSSLQVAPLSAVYSGDTHRTCQVADRSLLQDCLFPLLHSRCAHSFTKPLPCAHRFARHAALSFPLISVI